MRAHRFLIWCLIWLLMAEAVLGAVQSCQMYVSLSGFQRSFGMRITALWLVAVEAAIRGIYALMLLRAWYALARRKASGPNALTQALLTRPLIMIVGLIFTVANDPMMSFLHEQTSVQNMAQEITLSAFALLLAALYRRYYNARDHFFVN